jgi:hypothetical protein
LTDREIGGCGRPDKARGERVDDGKLKFATDAALETALRERSSAQAA